MDAVVHGADIGTNGRKLERISKESSHMVRVAGRALSEGLDSTGRVPAKMLRLDGLHRGRGLAAAIGGLLLGAIAEVVASKANPALSSLDAVVVSIVLLVFLVGALLVLLGIGYWLAGRNSTWPIAIGKAALVAVAVVLTFLVTPAMWMYAMRLLGPEWAKELVTLLYLGVAFAATVMVLRTPKKQAGPSGVSAYGRTLIRR